ncbi:hypothetical protein O181_025499, partial [Austropuccinia psidii MF-1]|nr:hypothetical protein [Austropuccinia psidii MF-1]
NFIYCWSINDIFWHMDSIRSGIPATLTKYFFLPDDEHLSSGLLPPGCRYYQQQKPERTLASLLLMGAQALSCDAFHLIPDNRANCQDTTRKIRFKHLTQHSPLDCPKNISTKNGSKILLSLRQCKAPHLSQGKAFIQHAKYNEHGFDFGFSLLFLYFFISSFYILGADNGKEVK